jgi:hypothetical protein
MGQALVRQAKEPSRESHMVIANNSHAPASEFLLLEATAANRPTLCRLGRSARPWG